MSNSDLNSIKLRRIILNTREPIIFKQFPLNWSCFQSGLEDWCTIFDESNSGVDFERVKKDNSVEPQWERKREKIQMTAVEFLKEHSEERDYWSGLNYKRRHELPDKCTHGIDFSALGFPEAADDCTFWLSSTGANTPCHYDTYGCNIVVQVFGKKSWLLFPPNTPLTTTRIPYEESSIYCKENFYSPANNIKKLLENCKDLAHHVILEPNDILIVPKHWWHYVEAVDISLSVNTWIPLECDVDQQLEECIVKYLIENFLKDHSTTIQKYVMNPNQLMSFSTKHELFTILNHLAEKWWKKDTKRTDLYDYQYLSEYEVDKLFNEIKSSLKVSPITSTEFENYLKTNSLRCNEVGRSNCVEMSLLFMEEILINSICDPHVIKAIKNEFLNRYNEDNQYIQSDIPSVT